MAFDNTPSAVHVDEYLTSFSISHATEQNYIAPRLFPILDVEFKSDLFYVFSAAEENREFTDAVTELAPRTLPRKFDVTHSNSSYLCKAYGLAFDIDLQTAANEDKALKVRQRKAKLLMDNLMKKRDRDFISTFVGTGIWDVDLAGTTDFVKWSDASSNPIKDVLAWKEAFEIRNYGMKPNKILMTPDIKQTLLTNTAVLGRINGGATVANPAMVNDSLIASIFEVDEIVYADVVSNNTNPGQTESAARMLTDQMLMVHTPNEMGEEVPAAGTIFAYNAIPGFSWGITMESFTGEHLAMQQLAEEVHGKMAYDMKVTGSSLGTYISDLI